jgi:adenine-specific DNA-methyltransferase
MAHTYRAQPNSIDTIDQQFIVDRQGALPLDVQIEPRFPATRFQGSKAKLVDWIWDGVKDLEFDSALDAFGGTGSVSHRLKREGKLVSYNDFLRFNFMIGQALIENSEVRLLEDDVIAIIREQSGVEYPTFIQDTFQDIYYTEEENRWLDVVVTNIRSIEDRFQRALAFFALFQACIIKRPFNLFHRKNLSIRTNDVKRSFGNKTTWDKPFTHWFPKFVTEADLAVFDNGRQCLALNEDPATIAGHYDLIYIDPPYISPKGVGVDYLHFYHFLEGLTDYDNWSAGIDYSKKHRPLKDPKSEWTDPKRIYAAFERLFDRYSDSILAVSYRDNGIPSAPDLMNLLRKYKSDVQVVRKENYKYVLSTYNSSELLFIAK